MPRVISLAELHLPVKTHRMVKFIHLAPLQSLTLGLFPLTKLVAKDDYCTKFFDLLTPFTLFRSPHRVFDVCFQWKWIRNGPSPIAAGRQISVMFCRAPCYFHYGCLGEGQGLSVVVGGHWKWSLAACWNTQLRICLICWFAALCLTGCTSIDSCHCVGCSGKHRIYYST